MKMRRIRSMAALAALAGAAAAGRAEAQEAVYYRVQAEHDCARLGIAFQAEPTRLRVVRLRPGSAAERSGLRPGDVLLRIDGRPAEPWRLGELSARLQPGDTVRLRVRRGGGEREVAVVAERDRCTQVRVMGADAGGALPHLREAMAGLPPRATVRVDTLRIPVDSLGAHMARLRLHRMDDLRRRAERVHVEMRAEMDEMHEEMDRRARRLELRLGGPGGPDGVFRHPLDVGRRAVAGAELAELNPALAEYFGGHEEGLLVLSVAAATPGARAGLRPGDVLLRVDGEPVRSIESLRDAIARGGRDGARLEVVRKGERHTLRLGRE